MRYPKIKIFHVKNKNTEVVFLVRLYTSSIPPRRYTLFKTIRYLVEDELVTRLTKKTASGFPRICAVTLLVNLELRKRNPILRLNEKNKANFLRYSRFLSLHV